MSVEYVSVIDVRDFIKVDDTERDDASVTKLIQYASGLIDERTGKSWNTQTVTDEYYDGDGSNTLYLHRTNVKSLTALSIDDDLNNTYTSVTTTYVQLYEDEGKLVIDNARFTPEVTAFTNGPRTVKVSYTFGESAPTDDIKRMTLLIIANELRPEDNRRFEIDRMFRRLRNIGCAIIPK